VNFKTLTRQDVQEILHASEGIPSQVSSARIENGGLLPATTGHPVSSHLHSAGLVENKTKFLSMADMAEALWQLLQTPAATATLAGLRIGSRATVKSEVTTLFGFECHLPDPQGRGTVHRVIFTPAELRKAGRARTTCVAIVEGRERAGREYLQIHSFYPAMSPTDAQALLLSIRNRM